MAGLGERIFPSASTERRTPNEGRGDSKDRRPDTILLLRQLAHEPRASESPVAQDALRGDFQDFGGFLNAWAAEKAQFHRATFRSLQKIYVWCTSASGCVPG
jgi:hypothetical protein